MTHLNIPRYLSWIPTVAWLLLVLNATLVTAYDSRMLVIAVSAGIGGGVLLVVVALVAFACIRKHRILNGRGKAVMENTRPKDNASPAELSHRAEDVVTSPLPEEKERPMSFKC